MVDKLKIFKVPFDTKREEKIFGGYLSIRQVIYLAIGLLGLCSLLLPVHLSIKVIIIAISITFACLCAFVKISDMYFDKLLFEFIKYLKRKKSFTYERWTR